MKKKNIRSLLINQLDMIAEKEKEFTAEELIAINERMFQEDLNAVGIYPTANELRESILLAHPEWATQTAWDKEISRRSGLTIKKGKI